MKRQNKKGTLKKRMYNSNVIMVSIIIVCIPLFNVINSFTIDKYNDTVVSLKTLSSFYENINTATAFIKSYLYTENKETLEVCKKHMKQAHNDMEVLKEEALNEDYFRFVMLENMLDNYQKKASNLVNNFDGEENYTEEYNDFLNTQVLIEETSGNYYNYITKAVNTQLDNLRNIKKSVEYASLMLMGILLGWLYFYFHQISHSIMKPLDELLTNINRVKDGTFDLSDVSDTSQEMETLCNAMNEMAFSIQRSIETTKENAQLEKQLLVSKNDNLKKDEQLAQSELKMLQNQINPHFLFNTLNMIYKMTIQAGANDAADNLLKTTQLLRYGLDKQNRLSDIKSEVEMLKNYIEIQKIRLGNRVNFDLCFENRDRIGSVQIPGMILQPLVENAIKHGLKDCTSGGIVEINIFGNETLATIVIVDNGCGMDSSELEQFIIHDYHKDGENHLGLYNVVKRLQMYYQEHVIISINSDCDCGFEIVISIEKP